MRGLAGRLEMSQHIGLRQALRGHCPASIVRQSVEFVLAALRRELLAHGLYDELLRRGRRRDDPFDLFKKRLRNLDLRHQ
jgi:hypothetical protein